MKKITAEEFDAMLLHGTGSTTVFRKIVMAMQPGDAIVFYKKDWHVKYAPTRILNDLERKYNTKYERGSLVDRSGWAVKRVR